MATPILITGPVNLGNPTEFTILELAELTIRMTDSKSKLVFMPLPQDDPQQRQPNIEKASKLLRLETHRSPRTRSTAHNRVF